MLHRSKIQQLIRLLGHTIFGITFIKRNGDVRTMSCRARVSKYVKGVRPGGSSSPANDLIVLYEMNGKAHPNYKSISLDTITRVTVNGLTAQVTPDPIVQHVDVSTDYNKNQLQLLDIAS